MGTYTKSQLRAARENAKIHGCPMLVLNQDALDFLDWYFELEDSRKNHSECQMYWEDFTEFKRQQFHQDRG